MQEIKRYAARGGIYLQIFGTIEELNFLTLECETEGLSRKVGKELPSHPA